MNEKTNRREFTKRAIAASVAASCGLAFDGGGKLYAQAGGITDEDILNFALNLEYLEAEFYTVATTGKRIADLGIDISGRTRQGATTGGGKVALDSRVQVVADQIALDEQAHVKLLRSALRSSAVAKPSINLEALGLGFRTQAEFLTVASIFEDAGVSAYRGAAPLIQNRDILSVAAGIALTEGQHAGVLRYLASDLDFKLAVPSVDPKAVPPLGQPPAPPTTNGGRLFFVEGLGLSPARTVKEVLMVVYGGTPTKGGFFPDGVNGKIA
ncbi:MAG: ferritin-like domain-containing protein [Vicinamibacterales bacterium]